MSVASEPLPAVIESTKRARPRRAQALPGVRPAIGVSAVFVTLLVVVPVCALLAVVARAPTERIVEVLTAPRTLAAYGLSLGASLAAALVSVPLGLTIAWTLARYDLPGRRVLDALVDLPFAMPTAVSGIALTALYAPDGPFGAPLSALGLEVAFHRAGIVLALVLVSLPFVVRTVQPVLESFPREVEEAALSLGASRTTTFWRVILPSLRPALASGAILAFARSLGEYGSVVFIAGNVPMRTEIAPLLVLVHLEEYDYVGAAIVATGLLVASVGILLLFQSGERRLAGHGRRS
jgi:sulfate transport system permease protein